MSLDFTAIDFETAGAERGSVCAVGLARVRNGVVVDRFSTLVCPPTGLESFRDWNTAVNGITPDMVRTAPSWDQVGVHVMAFIASDVLVAHNAPFDRSVLQQASTMVDQEWPDNDWFDTLVAARATLTLGSYGLEFVVQALGLSSFAHHEALADAEAAAMVAVELAKRSGSSTLASLQDYLRVEAQQQAAARLEPLDFSMLAGTQPLSGEHVAFTGKLTTNTREEAIALVDQLGGVGQGTVTRATTMLVTGDLDPRTFRPGAVMTGKLQKAMASAEAGRRIEILTEAEFMDRLDLTREELERATRAQRAASRSGWLPRYVVEQARALQAATLPYNEWLRRALRHPDGRAVAGDTCIRCAEPLNGHEYWLLLERHVCSGDCGDALKRAAKSAWRAAGLMTPDAVPYDPEWHR